MRDGFAGIDLNGGTDRCLHIEWPTKIRLWETRIDQGIVINPTDNAAPFLVSDAAKRSPIARGWSWPLWAAKAGVRHNVADLLNHLRNDEAPRGADEVEMLAAHIRHLVSGASKVGLVVPDDFGPGAQTRLLEVARRANRFDPERGWISWTPFPIWRSVAAVFAWASRLDADKITQLRGRRITVVSILDDRLTVGALEIDYERVDERVLVTPVRQTIGKGSPNNFTPKFAETGLVELIGDKKIRDQVEAIAGARALTRIGTLPCVFQRDDGTWFENRNWPKVNEELTGKLRERGLADIHFLKDQIPKGDIVLIECSETDRRLGTMTIPWSSWYAKKIMELDGIVANEVFELRPEDAASGACEYVARISNDLPTYFDHIYGIEIAAFNADSESHEFIALFPEETRVAGNKVFQRRLEGRFAIQPGSQTLSFHLWRQDDPTHVRTSKTDLDISPNDQVPITLEVTQRPVSGYATIEVLPEIDGALGGRRIILDWETMGVDAKSRQEIIAELDLNLPKSFPNYLPTITHPVAWENIDPRSAMRNYLSTPVTSSGFDRAASDLRSAISRRISSPRYYNVDIDHPVYLFDSNGDVPTGFSRERNGDPADFVAKVRVKITEDIKTLGNGRVWRSDAGMPREMIDLFLAGCWMYAGAPEACLAYLRDVFRGRADIKQRVESIGRVVSSDDDVKAALKWLMDRLRQKASGKIGNLKITKELKTVSTIIQYREHSYRFLDLKDAHDLVRFSVKNISALLQAKNYLGQPRDLKFSFLFSAMVFLLALRYRKKDARFLEPPAKGEKANQIFSEALQILQHAYATIKDDIRRRRRSIHRLAPEVISNAIEFLQKTGGNPDIIMVISKAESDDDESEDED